MRKIARAIFLAIACASAAGCASIVDGSSQVLSVQTNKDGSMLAGASCTLVNNKGTYFVSTPGTVTVHRSYDDMNVDCTKQGEQPGIATVKSSTKGMAFGNILAGGLIGAAVDMGTGAAYDYPSLITVQMGSKTVITPPKNSTGAAQAENVDQAPEVRSAQATPSK